MVNSTSFRIHYCSTYEYSYSLIIHNTIFEILIFLHPIEVVTAQKQRKCNTKTIVASKQQITIYYTKLNKQWNTVLKVITQNTSPTYYNKTNTLLKVMTKHFSYLLPQITNTCWDVTKNKIKPKFLAATHPNLLSTLKKEYSYNYTPRLGLRGLLQGELHFYL
jgi:hypothetical protein